jgi:hypothetical protein
MGIEPTLRHLDAYSTFWRCLGLPAATITSTRRLCIAKTLTPDCHTATSGDQAEPPRLRAGVCFLPFARVWSGSAFRQCPHGRETTPASGIGADRRNRTDVYCLEGSGSTIELHPQSLSCNPPIRLHQIGMLRGTVFLSSFSAFQASPRQVDNEKGVTGFCFHDPFGCPPSHAALRLRGVPVLRRRCRSQQRGLLSCQLL